MSNVERTGWRDEALSRRHRRWGKACTMTDIDFLACEYCTSEPFGIVEYKNEHAANGQENKPAYRALAKLATRGRIGFYECRYATDFSCFLVTPLNDFARKRLPVATMMTERGWVAFLYALRNRPIPDSIRWNDDEQVMDDDYGT